MQGNFIRVYQVCPDGRRVMFVYLYSPRLKSNPLALVGFCCHSPWNSESHTYTFTETWKFDLRRELHSFVNASVSDEEFRIKCRLSQDAFYSLLVTLKLPDSWNFGDFDRLF